MDDVKRVYEDETLAMSGQVDLNHYETGLNRVLGPKQDWIARELLTHACIHGGFLRDEFVKQWVRPPSGSHASFLDAVRYVLRVLVHDGRLAIEDGGYRFVSGLLEDWWCKSHGGGFDSFSGRPLVKR